MEKLALFVFNGDPMCFIHVLLNALDMKEKGHECVVIIEGAAVKLIPELADSEHPLNKLWVKTNKNGLIEGACRACANKMGVLDAIQSQGLRLLDNMSGHPSMAGYIKEGFTVITF